MIRDTCRPDHLSDAYAPVTILRLLQLMTRAEDGWRRTDQLMDHLEDTGTAEEEVSRRSVHSRASNLCVDLRLKLYASLCTV